MEFLSDEKVILRDFIESDIQTRVRWETEETEWQAWDAPWEFAALSGKEREAALAEYIEKMQRLGGKIFKMPEEENRTVFMIVEKSSGEYIGWSIAYRTTRTQYLQRGRKVRGGNRSALDAGAGKGIRLFRSAPVYPLFARLRRNGNLYADVVGERPHDRACGEARFRGIQAKKGLSAPCRGKKYDGLTFRLNLEKFRALG